MVQKSNKTKQKIVQERNAEKSNINEIKIEQIWHRKLTKSNRNGKKNQIKNQIKKSRRVNKIFVELNILDNNKNCTD